MVNCRRSTNTHLGTLSAYEDQQPGFKGIGLPCCLRKIDNLARFGERCSAQNLTNRSSIR